MRASATCRAVGARTSITAAWRRTEDLQGPVAGWVPASGDGVQQGAEQALQVRAADEGDVTGDLAVVLGRWPRAPDDGVAAADVTMTGR